MGKNGGKRPGAGRKPGPLKSTLAKAEVQAVEREAFRDFIKPHLDEMHAAQASNAKGLKYLVTRDAKSGKFVRVTKEMAEKRLGDDDFIVEVWEKDPSSHAYGYLMDQFLDKPRQQTENVKIDAQVTFKWQS